jgi:hypothetical protein
VLAVVSMSRDLVPALQLSSVAAADRRHGAEENGDLPLPRLVPSRSRSTVYGVAAVDVRGRIADRVVLQALGWSPGTRVAGALTDGVIILCANSGGGITVTDQGQLRLPASLRGRAESRGATRSF